LYSSYSNNNTIMVVILGHRKVMINGIIVDSYVISKNQLRFKLANHDLYYYGYKPNSFSKGILFFSINGVNICNCVDRKCI
jgi:hypothetical protein